MRTAVGDWPWWLLIAVWFAFFGILNALSRYGVRRMRRESHRQEVADYAAKTLNPIGAMFAFLIGFAATMTWSALTAGQEAIDAQATSAQQLAWATKSISNGAGAAQVVGNLDRYLSTAVDQDPPFLARGDTTALPSAQAFDTLQHSVHTVAYQTQTTTAEGSAMTAAAAALTGAQAKVAAVAQRRLPPVMIGLLLASGALLAVAMGASAAGVYRPWLMFGWALVSAIAMTLILALDIPFGGAIKVNMKPLVQVSDTLISEPMDK